MFSLNFMFNKIIIIVNEFRYLSKLELCFLDDFVELFLCGGFVNNILCKLGEYVIIT